MTLAPPAPHTSPDVPRSVLIDPKVWRQFNEWTRALGIQLIRVQHSPAQTPRYSMVPSTAAAAQRRARDEGLAERELQVLIGMSEGMTNVEIGKQLFISEDTVKTHARRLFRKLGVRDRAQAVAAGFRRGLLT